MIYVKALLDENKGKLDQAEDGMLSLVAENTQTAEDALMNLAEKYAAGETPHQNYVDDIGAVARLNRGSEIGARAAILEGLAYAEQGHIMASILLLRNAAQNGIADGHEAVVQSRKIIADAFEDDAPATRLEALSAYLKHRSFVDSPDSDVAFRKRVSLGALQLGLPNVAYKVIHHNPVDGDQEYAFVKSKAALDALVPEKVLETAAAYAGDPTFAQMIVQANLRLDNNYAALAAANNLPDGTSKQSLIATSAWRAGEWRTVMRAYTEMDPSQMSEDNAIQFAMSAFMAGEKQLPTAAEAVLTSENSPALPGIRQLFSAAPQGSVVERGRELVQRTSDEIKLIEETLING